MAASFVIGRAGSGKTHRCIASIVEALRQDPWGPPIFWVVPRQATFLAERELVAACARANDRTAIGRARVVSFETLCDDVLADCGGAAVPELTALGRQMILGHLLRQNEKELRFFAGVAHHSGLAAKLDATLAELQNSGIESNQLSVDAANRVADEAQSARPAVDLTSDAAASLGALAAKLHDLRLIFNAYSNYLGQDRLDQHRRLEYVLKCIEKSRLLKGATVLVDGFAHFSHIERQMLAALGKSARRMEIMLLMDPGSAILRDPNLIPEEMSLFQPLELAYRKLYFALHERNVAIERPVTLLSDVRRFKNKALSLIERQLLVPRSSAKSRNVANDPAGITLVEAQSRRNEVDAAARQVKQWTAEGMRYRDIVVLVRHLDDYGDLIAAAFAEHEIPFFIDRRRSAAHHPLVNFLRQAFVLARGAWAHEAMMDLLKCGLSGLRPEEADRLENYVLRHRIRAGAWTREWKFAETGDREISDESPPSETTSAEQMRRMLHERIGPWVALFDSQKPMPARHIIIELFKMMERFQVRQTLAQWMSAAELAGRLEQRDEHQQVWENVAALLDQMVDLLGDEPMLLDDFQEVAEAALEQFDLALTPPTVDQVVVGQVDRTRSISIRAAAVLGMNEGVFPRGPRDDSILSDADRRDLGERRLDIEPGTRRRLLDENLLAYVALTRASEQLWVSRALGDDAGKPLGPSPFWRRLRELFPALVPVRVDEPDEALHETAQTIDCIGTPRQLAMALMRWARSPNASLPAPGSDLLAGIYDWLRQQRRENEDDGLAHTLMRAWPALAYQNTAAISQQTAAELFGLPLKASAARLEAFAACPFSHFVHYGLGLTHRDEGDVSAGDLGSVYHRVLQQFVTEMLRQHKSWDDLPADEQRKLIHRYTEQAGQDLRDEILVSSARNRYMLRRAEKTLEKVVTTQAAVQRSGKFRPSHAKVAFGPDARLPAFHLQTPNGNELEISGSVDRIDCLQDHGDATPFLVIDYKLGGGNLTLDEVYHGLSLQLLTALLVLQDNGQSLAKNGMQPAAAFYVRLRRGLSDVNHPEDAMEVTDPRFALQAKPSGIFDARYLSALDASLVNGVSQVVRARIKKDGQAGAKNKSDLADPDEFAGLLAQVRRKLGELADEIIGGNIGIRPYRLRKQSPCAGCSYQSVCRFERGINRYKFLEGAARIDVLRMAAEAHGRGQ